MVFRVPSYECVPCRSRICISIRISVGVSPNFVELRLKTGGNTLMVCISELNFTKY